MLKYHPLIKATNKITTKIEKIPTIRAKSPRAFSDAGETGKKAKTGKKYALVKFFILNMFFNLNPFYATSLLSLNYEMLYSRHCEEITIDEAISFSVRLLRLLARNDENLGVL